MKIEWAFSQLPSHHKETVKYGLATEGTIMFFTALKLAEENAILSLNSKKLSECELKEKFKEHQFLITHYKQLIYFLSNLKEETSNVQIKV